MTVPALDTASAGAAITRLEVSFFPGERGGDRADQRAAWDEVEGMMARHGAESASASAAEAEERVFHWHRRRGNAVGELMARAPGVRLPATSRTTLPAGARSSRFRMAASTR